MIEEPIYQDGILKGYRQYEDKGLFNTPKGNFIGYRWL
jgi:hypothetical protein